MKTLKSIFIIIFLVGFVQACTVDDTIEEQIFIQNKEILGTGSDGGAGSDVSKGS